MNAHSSLLRRLAPRPATHVRPSKEDLEFESKCLPIDAFEKIGFRCQIRQPEPHPASFTEESSILKVALGKRKGSGRPPSEHPKRRRRNVDTTPFKPTRLRKNKPIKAEVNYDVWNEILSWTEPATLFKIKSTSKMFYDILSRESLWEKARIHTYGAEMPEPPEGMNNSTYLEMITGNHCQVCGTTPVRKVYWAFLKRWCNECYRKLTIREREAKNIMIDNPDLLWSLMHATRDSWTNYVQAGYVRNQRVMQNHNYTPCWLESDVHALKKDFSDFTSKLPADITPEDRAKAIQEFGNKRIPGTKKLLEHVRRIEKWHGDTDHERFAEYRKYRAEREAFFKRKASEENPPISEQRLLSSSAYARYRAIPKPPSERSWELLLLNLKEGH